VVDETTVSCCTTSLAATVRSKVLAVAMSCFALSSTVQLSCDLGGTTPVVGTIAKVVSFVFVGRHVNVTGCPSGFESATDENGCGLRALEPTVMATRSDDIVSFGGTTTACTSTVALCTPLTMYLRT
jgi:hypothetical protein